MPTIRVSLYTISTGGGLTAHGDVGPISTDPVSIQAVGNYV